MARRRSKRSNRNRPEPPRGRGSGREDTSSGTRRFGRPARHIAALATFVLLIGTFWAIRSVDQTANDRIRIDPGGATGHNLLMITVDTLRADHVGCYGYQNVATPVIDRLAERGVRFAQAVTCVPMTLPSHASIMTGKYPPSHGVRDNGAFRLAAEQKTLAEILAQRGFKTAAFVAAFVLDSRYGLEQGFSHYDDNLTLRHRLPTPQATAHPERPADVVVDAAIAWFTEQRGVLDNDRFFVWVHLYDPHLPYAPPQPFLQQYKDRRYDGEIAFVDFQIGRLLDALEGMNRLEQTVTVLVGDHGEGLGEHGEPTHRHLIYESTMHVPMILSCPGVVDPGVVDGHVVSIVDLMPTVLELLGVPVPPECDGQSLLGVGLDADRAVYLETLSPRLNEGWAPLFGLRRLRDKYIEAPTPEYYNLQDDPHETRNLLARAPDQADDLRAMLEELMATFPAADATAAITPTAEEIKRLAALGYVTGTGAGERYDPNLDPKVMILDFDERLRGIHLMDTGQPLDAIEIFQSLLRGSTHCAELWSLLATARRRLGDLEEATVSARRAVEISPWDAKHWCALASIYFAAKNPKEARVCLTEAERVDPAHGRIYVLRGRQAIKRGDYEQAIELFATAAQRDPVRATAQANALRGQVYRTLGRIDEAEQAFDSALQHDPRNGTALLGMSRILTGRGDNTKAIGLLQLLIQGQPEFIEGGRLMGRLYFETGQPDIAVTILRVVLQHDPNDADAHYQISRVFASRAQINSAFHHLEKAAALEAIDLKSLRTDPAFASILDHPRLAAIEKSQNEK